MMEERLKKGDEVWCATQMWDLIYGENPTPYVVDDVKNGQIHINHSEHNSQVVHENYLYGSKNELIEAIKLRLNALKEK